MRFTQISDRILRAVSEQPAFQHDIASRIDIPVTTVERYTLRLWRDDLLKKVQVYDDEDRWMWGITPDGLRVLRDGISVSNRKRWTLEEELRQMARGLVGSIPITITAEVRKQGEITLQLSCCGVSGVCSSDFEHAVKTFIAALPTSKEGK